MAHTFFQKYLEIMPLCQACILELVDHDMLQLRSDFLKNKGRITVTDERVEQDLGVTQQEAVSLVVEFVNPAFDAAE